MNDVCPVCGAQHDGSRWFCSRCDFVFDEAEFRCQRETLRRIEELHELYVILPAPIDDMTPSQIFETLSFQRMVESDMNTSTDFNPDGRMDYHSHPNKHR